MAYARATDTPSLNHPTNRLGAWEATHGASMDHFNSDGVAHGNESYSATHFVPTHPTPPWQLPQFSSSLRSVSDSRNGGSMRGGDPGDTATINSPGTGSQKGVPTGSGGTLYGMPEYGTTGVYSRSNGAGFTWFYDANKQTWGNLANDAFSALVNGYANSTIGKGTDTGTGTTTGTTGGTTKTPFDKLADLLANFQAAAPTGGGGSADTAPQAVSTSKAASPIIPLVLILLAAGIGYYYYKKHHGASV